MAKSYQRKGRKMVRISFLLQRRYVRFLKVDASYCRSSVRRVNGSNGLIAQIVKRDIHGWLSDDELVRDLVGFGLDLSEWTDKLGMDETELSYRYPR